MEKESVVLLGCGDVGPIHEPMGNYSTLVRETLAQGDIRFAQVERIYSHRGELKPGGADGHSRLDPRLISIFSDCGFDVVSVASNHAMDFGGEALVDSIALFQSKGIKTVGAGRNLEEARRPAFIERNGIRVGFLAYCSVLQEGYAAGPDNIGVAPLRAHTHYEPVDYQAGVPPKVVTVPDEKDLQAMVDDIKNAKKSADVLVLSVHWGIHFVPRLIADYQPIAAKAAFAAGADLILGHHAHCPKAIGVHDGKVCFYSLSNFMMSSSEKKDESAARFEQRYGVKLDPEYPRLPYGPDGKRSMIAKAVLTRAGVKKVSFLPVLIDKQLRPEILRNGDPRFGEAVNFMKSASEGYSPPFSIADNEVVVAGA